MTDKQEKSLSERMANLEDKLDYLIYADKPRHEPNLSEADFKTFYSRVEREFEQIGVMGGAITYDEALEYANKLGYSIEWIKNN